MEETQRSRTAGETSVNPSRPALRLIRPRNPTIALGLAVNYLMTKPAFARQQFGEWSRILVGQINRGHYGFAVDDKDRIRGFVGWALTTEEKAEAWLAGRRELTYGDSLGGDCIVFNAWSAESATAHRFLVDAARRLSNGRKTIYFKRHYADGSTRPVRLSANDFLAGHIVRGTPGPVEAAG